MHIPIVWWVLFEAYRELWAFVLAEWSEGLLLAV